jgi:DNA (cytosine-5)-methyltransferase 1
MKAPFRSADFFAGSGLVTLGLESYFQSAWANDLSPSKARIFRLNHPEKKFLQADICDVSGTRLPIVDLAWASFPCQDLSLAGKNGGIDAARSGLVWEWMRVLSEMPQLPSVVVAENVYGLLSSNQGRDYLSLHDALTVLGYQVGAIVLDAYHFLPQSRVRVFVVGYLGQAPPALLSMSVSTWCHPRPLLAIAQQRPDFRYWALPHPAPRNTALRDLIDRSEPVVTSRSELMRKLIPADQLQRCQGILQADSTAVLAGYRRTRADGQRLELRFDQQSGCLRTAKGGSSKQILVFQQDGMLACRFMSPREAARAMGAPDSFVLAGTANEAYTAMGDAVALPVTRHLATHLLSPLVLASRNQYADRQLA